MAAVAALVLSGCGAQPAGSERVERVWPSAPAQARIAWVTQFASPADLGIRVGFLERVQGIFTGREDRSLARPMAVAVTADKVYYVADPGRRGVHRYDLARSSYALVGGPDRTGLPSPVGLALTADGGVYVTDSYLGHVYRIAPGARSAGLVALEGALEQPTGIAVDPDTGRLYVVDTARHEVAVFDVSGKRIATIGRRGAGAGEFNYPTMIWRSGRELLVTDSMNFRVEAFDLDGRFLRAFGSHGDGSGDLSRPKGVATDRAGHVYVTDALFHVFQIFDNEGRFLLTVGTNGSGVGEFLLPTGIYIDADDTIYLCDSQNHRVQVFRYIGGSA